jgi:hypothetical protein
MEGQGKRTMEQNRGGCVLSLSDPFGVVMVEHFKRRIGKTKGPTKKKVRYRGKGWPFWKHMKNLETIIH